MKKVLKWIWGIALTALVGYLAADRAGLLENGQEAENQDEIEKIREAQTRKQNEARTRQVTEADSFCDAAEMAVNSVVYVKVVTKSPYQSHSSLLDLLFGFVETPRDQVGIGSGVIISEDGYIVTNNHVVSGGDDYEVTLYDNTVWPARLIGTDPATDIALLKIEKEGCIPLPMGDSDSLRLGEWVLAIGSPYDLRSTITAGIVSAKGRSFPNYDGQYRVESFIQTDAAVNPGNSGGALVNMDGELVGINTSIISKTGSYTGYSFAVPVNIVRKITDDFIEYGQVQRAVLGISMKETSDGIMVAEVKEASAAEAAGVKPGDIVRQINFQPVRTATEIQVQINKYRPGERIVLTVDRDGEQKELIVNL